MIILYYYTNSLKFKYATIKWNLLFYGVFMLSMAFMMIRTDSVYFWVSVG
jgi:hypothetical protein